MPIGVFLGPPDHLKVLKYKAVKIGAMAIKIKRIKLGKRYAAVTPREGPNQFLVFFMIILLGASG
jgi:hypothetical protein